MLDEYGKQLLSSSATYKKLLDEWIIQAFEFNNDLDNLDYLEDEIFLPW